MNNLNIDYFVTVDIDGFYGKEKATKEKVECLKLLSNSFELYSLKRQEKNKIMLIWIFWFLIY